MQIGGLLRRVRAVFAGALLLAVPLTAAGTAVASVTELVVADRRAGIALYGFDPVSYFLDASAAAGSETHELMFQGFAWHFRSEANRAAFRADPDVFVPRFGGYDPVALARSAPVAGHPAIFAVHRGRLYLFQKTENRDAFLADPEMALEAARAAWPRARASLVHY
jgi:YHS domain-containing protein